MSIKDSDYVINSYANINCEIQINYLAFFRSLVLC